MSGGGQGGNPNLVLKPKHAPSYPGHAIKSEKDADFAAIGPSGPIGLKLGIRVKDGQTPTLTLTTRATPGHPGTPIPLIGPVPQSDPIVADLKAGLGCGTDEKWFAYTLNWTPALKLKFDSTLVLEPFEPPYVTDNGFEIVTVAFCHDTQNFTSGVYSYAVSVLPGKNSTGFPLSLPQKSSGKKVAKKSTKPKATSKSKSKKKSRR
jgi:hypothetical protein